jgi:hypothetical protein
MTMGTVTDGQAAGRVFCNYTQGLGRPPQHRHQWRPDEHMTAQFRPYSPARYGGRWAMLIGVRR